MSARNNHSLIVAGGGTGGHVLAGVAVADAWRSRWGADLQANSVIFVGAQGGIEEKLVPRAGYPLRLLKLGSLNRVSIGQKLKTAFQLPFSLIRSMIILLSIRPVAVLGVGGYASGPLLLMAHFMTRFGLMSCQTAILEQNSVPGFTNRLLGRMVKLVFCAFPGTENQFKRSRAIITGNPIRSSIRTLPAARHEPFTVFIFGGSQGALGINTLILDALPFLGDLKGRLRFIHQTGERDFDRVSKGHLTAGTGARVEKFIFDMPSAYAEASLLVCRAGSSTLAEIAAIGRAAVLIPFPFASDNHQDKNAEIFVKAGAAQLLRQQQAKGEDLAKIIRQFVENPSRLHSMEKAVTQFNRPNAAQDIVSELSGRIV